LLEQAMAVLGWSESDAAAALNTSLLRIRTLRRGNDDLSVLEVMTLTALLAAFHGAGNIPPDQVAEALARLRRSRPS
jgi:hypothetical protein